MLFPLARSSFEGTPTVGGGGAGPAGGGGGGSKGGAERLQYIQLSAPPPDAAAVVAPPPVETPKPLPTPHTPVPLPPIASTGEGVSGAAPGSGTAGGPGSGPGTGGGVGSGVGTGTGSSAGPGTGGGPGTSYPPSPTQFFLPPLPAPASVRGYHLIAYFDVDERGNSTLLGFNPSRDNGYNRKLREVLLALKFRPGVRADGTAVRDTVDIQFIF